MAYTIAFFGSKPYDEASFNEKNSGYGFELRYYKGHLNLNNVILTQGVDAVCIFVNDTADAEVIRQLAANGVKLLALRCAGYNNVDLKAAAENGITVVRVPAYSPYAVAEYTVALMLSLNRKIPRATWRTRDGNFSLHGLLGFDMYGKTAGIIGTGKIAKKLIAILRGFAMNFFVVMLGLIAVALPAAPFWDGAPHFNFVFGMAPRIVAASLTAFLVGSFLNAYVMSRMKVASGGRHFSARAIWSTVVGETADSLIFFPVAFGGIIAWQELLLMMCTQIVLKSMYEVIILPVTIRVVKAIKRIDGSDVYDEGISYKVWKISEI